MLHRFGIKIQELNLSQAQAGCDWACDKEDKSGNAHGNDNNLNINFKKYYEIY